MHIATKLQSWQKVLGKSTKYHLMIQSFILHSLFSMFSELFSGADYGKMIYCICYQQWLKIILPFSAIFVPRLQAYCNLSNQHSSIIDWFRQCPSRKFFVLETFTRSCLLSLYSIMILKEYFQTFSLIYIKKIAKPLGVFYHQWTLKFTSFKNNKQCYCISRVHLAFSGNLALLVLSFRDVVRLTLSKFKLSAFCRWLLLYKYFLR